MGQPPRAVLDHHKHVQHPERRSDRNEEVTCKNRLCMVLQEGGPALIATRLARRSLRHVLAYRSRRDPDPELDQQLIGNSFLAPERVFCGHPANQAAQLRWNRRSARPALQAPEDPSARSMPANDGRRPHVDHRIAPIERPGEQGQTAASGAIGASGLDTALDMTRELLAKHQIPSADRAGRTQERRDQPQDVKSYSEDCSRQLQHALIMPESTRVCRCQMSQQPRRELLRTTIGKCQFKLPLASRHGILHHRNRNAAPAWVRRCTHSFQRDARAHGLTDVADVTQDQASHRASYAPLKDRPSPARHSTLRPRTDRMFLARAHPHHAGC